MIFSLNAFYFSERDKVRMNHGGPNYDNTGVLIYKGYNKNTGVFTCSIAGTYHFEIRAMSGMEPLCISLQLIKADGVPHHQAVIYNYNYKFDATSFLSWEFDLEEGDRVRVVGCEGFLYDRVTLNMNYFQGHLVHAKDCKHVLREEQRELHERLRGETRV